MTRSTLPISRDELSGRLQKLMFLRLLFISLLLGISIVLLVKETQVYFGLVHTAHYVLITCVYFLTLVYAVIYKYGQKLLWFAYAQILIDTLLVTAVLYVTGGIESFFSFLYMLVIINASILLYKRGALITASVCSILYGLLLDLHYWQILHPLGSRGLYGPEVPGFHVFNLIAVHILSFYLVAYLSSYLSEQIRKSREELKARQVDFNRLEALNESIVNSIPSGLIALDASERIMLFNPAAEAIFGLKAVDLRGRRIREVLPGLMGRLENDAPPFIDVPHHMGPATHLPYLKASGEQRHLRLSIAPLSLTFSERKGRILVFQDMTKIRNIEEEMKRIEGFAMIGELAAAMAHEIRNPMASISGSIQLLKDGFARDDVNARLMDIVVTEIDRLNRLIKEFQLFAKTKKAHPEKFELNRLIRDSLELFQNSQHWRKKITISCDFRGAIEMESDPEQIKQVLWNLFLNACEAMPRGGVLKVRTDVGSNPGRGPGKQVSVAVRDTGNGIDEGILPKVFNPFFTTKAQGSGLGLAIAKGIVEGFHGDIRAANDPDGGAVITFSLPLTPGVGPAVSIP